MNNAIDDTEFFKIADEWTMKVATNYGLAMENRIRMIVRPKPRWLPEWAWMMVVRRVLAMEITR